MAEIAAGIAILIGLAAVWLASQANANVETKFQEFTQLVAKQVRDTQVEFANQTNALKTDLRDAKRGADNAQAQIQELSERVNALTRRTEVLEHELKSLRDSIPPQYRRAVPNRRDRSSA